MAFRRVYLVHRGVVYRNHHCGTCDCIGASGAMVGGVAPFVRSRPYESQPVASCLSPTLLWRTSVRFAFGYEATRPDGVKKVAQEVHSSR